ncbi:MAG: hypothetical protein CM1200mP2_45300 [Planctomycetaceae bacterium]|nr:MAG: hypothetical protein CM1200mP2_45300 [Planctomycetaceae bacterium]
MTAAWFLPLVICPWRPWPRRHPLLSENIRQLTGIRMISGQGKRFDAWTPRPTVLSPLKTASVHSRICPEPPKGHGTRAP